MRLPYNSRPISCVGQLDRASEGMLLEMYTLVVRAVIRGLLMSVQRALRGNHKPASSLKLWRACL